MLDAALDAVITIDSVGRILEVNAAVEAIFGHRPETLVGRELGEALVPPALRERHRAGLAHGTGKLLGKRVEITALHADGREFPVELTITRIDVPGPPMYTGYVRDITDRIAARAGAARRGRGSSPPPTRRAGGSSATSTTARRTGCWRSASSSRSCRTSSTSRAGSSRACARSCGSPPTSCASWRAASTPRC